MLDDRRPLLMGGLNSGDDGQREEEEGGARTYSSSSAVQRQVELTGHSPSGTSPSSSSSSSSSPLPRLSRFGKAAQIILFGQLISLCTCGTGVTSQALASNHKVSIPTAQSFANYLLLGIVYTSVLVYKGTFVKSFRERGLRYLLIAAIDVEANYTIVKAYQYTNLTSIQLLDCFTIFAVMVLSYFVLRARFARLHIIGVVLCLFGLGALVGADIMTDRDTGDYANKALGDGLCIIASCLYAASNVAQELSVKQHDMVEFLSMIGIWGTLINGIQFVILERDELKNMSWSPPVVGLLIGFAACLFLLYSLVPLLLRQSSATVMNLSLLTSDIYSLLFGLFLFHLKFSWLYFLAFGLVVAGIAVYNQATEVPPQQPRRRRD